MHNVLDACIYITSEVGGGWALEFPSFLGPVKWEQADRRVPFGAQMAHKVIVPPKKNYIPKFLKQRDIGNFMYQSAVVYCCCCVLLSVVGCCCVLLGVTGVSL